jgi:hypothetical protein
MQTRERKDMPRPRQRRTLETGLKLDLNHLIHNGVTTGEFRVRLGADDEGILRADLSEGRHNWLHLQVPGVDQTIALEWQRRPFGGKQWYFRCPLSGHRASILYRPRGMPNFACQKYWRRRCAYSSQFLTAYDRAHRNIARIEARLSQVNPKGEEDGLLYRPKNMREATFQRLWAELDRNEDILNERLVRVAARLMRWAR